MRGSGAAAMTTSDAEIRMLTATDAALFRAVRLEALQQSPEAYGSSFEQESARPLSWFEERVSQSDIFGAFAAGELRGIVGFAMQESPKKRHKGLLWGMYVRPAARNSGLGQRLVEAVLRHAAARAVGLVDLTVVSENRPALRLYENLGFVEYGHEKMSLKLNGRYYDEILMVKYLTPA
jgi:ribosomal protein S18 acetylase RimI-like enzyme